MKQKHKNKSDQIKKIASERIIELFRQSDIMFHEDSKLSDRYVQLARKISTRYKVKIPSEYKKQICKKCLSFLMPGTNCRIRLNKSKIVYTCLKCKNHMRFGLH